MDHSQNTGEPASRTSRWHNITLALGVVLTAAAIVVALRHMDWTALRDISPLDLLALCGLTLLNLLITSLLWWTVTRPFPADPTPGPWLMTRLIVASELLNHLPLRAGFIGRAVYLRHRHRMSLAHLTATVAIVLALATAVVVGVGLALLLLSGTLQWGLVGFYLVAITIACVAPWPGMQGGVMWRLWWTPLRVADLIVYALRLSIAFRIVGEPIAFDAALLVACAALLVQLAQLTPAGLGVREWIIAGLSGSMAAPLIDRAAATLVIIVTGSASLWTLRHARRGHAAVAGSSTTDARASQTSSSDAG